VRIPTRDLVADLVNPSDAFLDDAANVCRALPRHLRLYVASWMLSDGTAAGDKRGLHEALRLYDGCGRALLDQKRKLTTAEVVAEVLQLSGRGVRPESDLKP
jgi:hypothetical protein